MPSPGTHAESCDSQGTLSCQNIFGNDKLANKTEEQQEKQELKPVKLVGAFLHRVQLSHVATSLSKMLK